MPDIGKHKSYFMRNCCFGLPMPPRASASMENPLRVLLCSLLLEVHFQPPRAGRNLYCDVPGTDATLSFNH